ncbi:MAG TPA: DUF2332 domain-containing protein [Acidimicrobiales bacterium]|nr:DUF2332 domain-containing protein [Acidimicrobiales bacterium]
MYANRTELAEAWRMFAVQQCRGYSPLYEAIALAVAAAPDIVDLTLDAPLSGRQPNVLLAAVHDLLLRGIDDPLAAIYDGTSVAPVGEAFCAFVRAHQPEIADLLSTRRTNTNECGRSAVLLPALWWVSDHIGSPLALLDGGASAGLNLLLDRYRIDYGDHGATGPADSPVRIDCELVGEAPVRLQPPPIAARIGLDRAPVDLSNPDGARWLLACVWPDTGRLERTRAALELASANSIEVVAGDLADDLATVAAKLPSGVPLCVTTSWVLAYLSPRRRAAFVNRLADLAADRPVAWVNAEGPGVIEGLPPLPDLDPRFAGGIDPSVLAVTVFDASVPSTHVLGLCHAHGTWLQWTA